MTVEKGRPDLMIEVKTSDRVLTPGLRYFSERTNIPGLQLLGDLRVETEQSGLSVRQLLPWLQALET